MSDRPVINYVPAKTRTGARLGKGILGWILFIVLAIALFQLKYHRANATELPLSTINAQIVQHNVVSISINGDQLIGQFRYPVSSTTSFRTNLPEGMGNNWEFVKWLMDQGPRVTVEHDIVTNILIPFVPWLLMFLFIWIFVFRQLRATNAAKPVIPASTSTPEPIQ